MKKLLFLLIIPFLSFGQQQTYVPDDVFEQALIDLGYDDVLDNYVLTNNINTVTDLELNDLGISNLTGIAAFNSLTILYLDNNLLTSLDVSSNTNLTHLFCENNQLTSLNVSNNPELNHLYCYGNLLTSLDVSNTPCVGWAEPLFNGNPNLSCIQVDDADCWEKNLWWSINNSYQSYSENCLYEGCVDPIACNYDLSAGVDDNSCVYPNDCGSCDPENDSIFNELTYVPDDSFEEYIETNFPDADNGIENDNYVLTNGLNFSEVSGFYPTMIQLIPAFLSSPIFDLTGIENFRGNFYLMIMNQMIPSIDLSCVNFNNINALWLAGYISISNCTLLENIILPKDTISLDISSNPSLNNIEFHEDTYYWSADDAISISNNPNLCEIYLKGSSASWYYNGIETSEIDIEITNNNSLYQTDFSELTVDFGSTLNIVNNDNLNQIIFNTDDIYNWWNINNNNDNLTCIEVSNPDYCMLSNYWDSFDDELFSTDCYNAINCGGTTSIIEIQNHKTLITTIDILGRETTSNKGFQLHIYDDGSVEKKYLIK